MKLGVTYNVFDGEELLGASIRAIRQHVEHVNVVYQRVSNFGNQADPLLEKTIGDLTAQGLIDEALIYEPDLKRPAAWNEIRKRNLGLQIARGVRCSHFMNMDVDEFYVGDQFLAAKKYIHDNRIGCSAARYVNYIQKPIYRIQGLARQCVPFICKIGFFSKIRDGGFFPVTVDGTRALSGHKKFVLFDEAVLLMHHMSMVRRSLQVKYGNTSVNSRAPERSKFRESFATQWKFGQPFFYLNAQKTQWDPHPHDVIVVDNIFSIHIDDGDECGNANKSDASDGNARTMLVAQAKPESTMPCACEAHGGFAQ